MARGGKRKGAGAPKGNKNALKHGGRAKVMHGVPLDKELSDFEYKALCLVQLETLKKLNKDDSYESRLLIYKHFMRYKGTLSFDF
ncbi:hypothetical protein MTF68_13080 [Pseudoalteromonas sp. 2CM37A]|jgi:hypothetical protein|uniref:hypothetical protein n=1 Tax=Pseudoalteromonas sp. 2CM37A TaxID=2929853 RepID=UPI0020BFCC01|nr:hypothetical protein [Pseudoalteromonas sp. 2CM37A]MCK8118500.1 hypothetical protein [Pseudoalteromonas sp. 2CM37A]